MTESLGINPDRPPLMVVGWGRLSKRRRAREHALFRAAWERAGQSPAHVAVAERPEVGATVDLSQTRQVGEALSERTTQRYRAETEVAYLMAETQTSIGRVEAHANGRVEALRNEMDDRISEIGEELSQLRREIARLIRPAGSSHAEDASQDDDDGAFADEDEDPPSPLIGYDSFDYDYPDTVAGDQNEAEESVSVAEARETRQ